MSSPLKSDFKNGEYKVSPIDMISGDDFSGYSFSLNELFYKFATAISTDNLDWVKVSASNPNIISEIKNLKEKINGK